MKSHEISQSIGPFSLACTDPYIGIGWEYQSKYSRDVPRYRCPQFCIDMLTHGIPKAGGWQNLNWAPSSEFVSSSIPSWQILTAHAQPFKGARDLAFCLKVPFNSLLEWASSEGSGESARMRRLAWTFAARIGDKYQIRLTRSNSWSTKRTLWLL